MLHLTDSLTGKSVAFPKAKKPVRLFVCGPTVYDHSHIGHARTYIAFDAFVRFLRWQKQPISYIQNITDVDDKIIDRATQRDIPYTAIARQYERAYHAAEKKLNIISVDSYPRASSYIKEIIALIETLIAKGYAYQTNHGVYFEVKKFPRYGELSRQNLDAVRPGWRVEIDPQKKDPLDFALWKKTKGEKPAWQSPWGLGRPGWHIEDTAITQKLFGVQYDIHGGASELKFPHHESEIAQQEAVSGKHPMVKAWMHTGILLTNGQKMSKSLKNFITIDDFLSLYTANALRYLVLSHHYRSPIDYSSEAARAAHEATQSMEHFMAYSAFITRDKKTGKRFKIASFQKTVTMALENDFNTPAALAELFRVISYVNEHILSLHYIDILAARSWILQMLAMLGFTPPTTQKIPTSIARWAKEREICRASKQFMQADALRKKIQEVGYAVDDTPIGPFLYRQSS
ncbi:MAG: cysteine--tRNA ligase [Candidatus Paceibacterota bacterium]|jgi:cysteinyl-tRNA synthetase